MNFLIVDENIRLNDMLATYLESRGHTSQSAANAWDALRWLIPSHPYDCVILGIGKQKNAGILLILQIRSMHAKLPIVVYTGHGDDPELMQIAEEVGANEYVSKGRRPTEFYDALMRAVALASPQTES